MTVDAYIAEFLGQSRFALTLMIEDRDRTVSSSRA